MLHSGIGQRGWWTSVYKLIDTVSQEFIYSFAAETKLAHHNSSRHPVTFRLSWLLSAFSIMGVLDLAES